MSKFKTSIKVDVAAVLAALPPYTYVHGVTFDRESSSVQVEWENDNLRTPHTFATEIDLADIPKALPQVPTSDVESVAKKKRAK